MTDITMLPAGGEGNATKIKRDTGKPTLADWAWENMAWLIGGLIGLILLFFAFGMWPRTQQVNLSLKPGDSLVKLVGQKNAIDIAEQNKLTIWAQIIGSDVKVRLKPSAARMIDDRAATVIGLTVIVHEYDRISMQMRHTWFNPIRTLVPGTLTYRPVSATR